MAKNIYKSIKRKGRPMDELQSDVLTQGEAGDLGEQREDSAVGTGESPTKEEPSVIPPKLKNPAEESPLLEHFTKILHELQHLLVKEWGNLRVAVATVPSRVVPDFLDTGHGGIILKQGGNFSALLTDGNTIVAE